MLLRLILIALILFGIVAGIRWWRASRTLSAGGALNLLEMDQMVKLAKSSKRMEAALIMRTKIMEEAAKSNMQALSERVDPVLRKLTRQVELRQDIQEILREHEEDEIERQIRTARAELDSAADDSERIIADTKKSQLETQLEHVQRLKKQRATLNESADRIIRELQNLHLSLVNASATEAKAQLESGDVQSSLSQLEEASDELKRQAEAEEEVTALLRKAQQRQS